MIFKKTLKLIKSLTVKREKVRDFRKYKRGEDFSVDFFDSYNSAKMVSSILVRPGERIILQEQESTITYRVTEVEYYSNSNSVQEVYLKIDTEREVKEVKE